MGIRRTVLIECDGCGRSEERDPGLYPPAWYSLCRSGTSVDACSAACVADAMKKMDSAIAKGEADTLARDGGGP